MSRRRTLTCLLGLLLLLPGCWDQREPEELTYLTAVGIDKGRREPLAVTFVLSRPKEVVAEKKDDKGGKDSAGDKGEKSGVITIEARTIAGAVFYLNTVLPRPASLAQTKLFLLSEDLVRTQGMPVLDESSRNRQIRRSTMMVITKQPIADFLDGLSGGPEELSDFAAIQSKYAARASAFLPVRATLNDFHIRVGTSYQEPVTYYAALPQHEAREPSATGHIVPGAPRRQGGPVADFFGAAAFRRTKMVGVLDAEDTRAMLMIQDSFSQSDMEITDPLKPDEAVALRVSRGRRTRVKATLVDGKPRFQVLITLEGEVLAMPSSVNYTELGLQQQLEAAVARDVKEQVESFFKKTKEWKADVGGLGRHIVRRLPTVQAWHQFSWPDQYQDAEIQVTVTMRLRRFGIQLDPPSEKRPSRGE